MHVVNVEVVLLLNSSRSRFFKIYLFPIFIYFRNLIVYMSIDFFFTMLSLKSVIFIPWQHIFQRYFAITFHCHNKNLYYKFDGSGSFFQSQYVPDLEEYY